MEPGDLYARFDRVFSQGVLPYLEHRLPRDAYAAPIYHYIQRFEMRRFRSALPVLLGEILGMPQKGPLVVGAASELTFYAALVQDDIFDGDDQRGAIAAAHREFGTHIAYASADYANAVAMQMITELSEADCGRDTATGIMRGFANAQRRVYRSFLHEMLRAFDGTVTREEVRQLHLDKTIQGINGLTCLGMLVDDDAAGPTVKTFRSYAELLAQAGQIKNDIYDVERYSKTRGLSDLKNGYVNYLVCELICRPDMDANYIMTLLREGRTTEVVEAMRTRGVLEEAHERMSDLVEQALQTIATSQLPAGAQEVLCAWAEGNRRKSYATSPED